jgi:hypothetical protein
MGLGGGRRTHMHTRVMSVGRRGLGHHTQLLRQRQDCRGGSRHARTHVDQCRCTCTQALQDCVLRKSCGLRSNAPAVRACKQQQDRCPAPLPHPSSHLTAAWPAPVPATHHSHHTAAADAAQQRCRTAQAPLWQTQHKCTHRGTQQHQQTRLAVTHSSLSAPPALRGLSSAQH